MFLGKNLHASFRLRGDAFLKVCEVDIILIFSESGDLQTPNFALELTDIPRVEVDPMPPSRITLHHFKPDLSHAPLPQYDACIAGTGILPPSTIILDYMYGVAAYRRWGSGHDIKEVMQDRFTEFYKSIPIPPASLPSSDGHSSPQSDDDDDKSYKPG